MHTVVCPSDYDPAKHKKGSEILLFSVKMFVFFKTFNAILICHLELLKNTSEKIRCLCPGDFYFSYEHNAFFLSFKAKSRQGVCHFTEKPRLCLCLL